MRGAPKHFLHHPTLTLGGESIFCNFVRISEDRLLYAASYSLSKASERHFQKCSFNNTKAVYLKMAMS
jgi:hypothetical protein